MLHLRRVETVHEGLRWLDIKRYGIEISHNRDGETPDVLTKDDLRRAWQLPQDYLVIAVAALVSLVSCNNDTDLDHKSIFPDGVDKTTQNEFDLWVDAYNELMGRDFLRQYSPRMIQLIGSAEYKEDSSEVLGTAEGGMKIFLNKVNLLDLKKPDMSVIRFYYIKTMYHEFGHILQQTKNYSTDLNTISTDYQGPSRVNVGDYENGRDTEALEMGFISAYASSEPGEDFVEILSFYVVYGKEYWERMLTLVGEDGAEKMLRKYALIKNYLKTKWEIDIEKLEQIVQRRMEEVPDLELTALD